MLALMIVAFLAPADPAADKAGAVLAEARAALGLASARAFRLTAEVNPSVKPCDCGFSGLQTWSAPDMPRVNQGALFGIAPTGPLGP